MMSNLKIKDAPLLPALLGSEKIPTGGRGNFTTSADQLKDYIAKDLQVNVDAEVSRLDAVDATLDTRIYNNTLDISQNTGRITTVEAKVSTVAIGATANATNEQLRDRTTHTGVQPISSVSNLQTELNNRSLVDHTHTQQQVTGLVTRLSGIENSVEAESQARILFEDRRDNPHQVTSAQTDYLAPFSGAQTRTQADKNADFKNVKDFSTLQLAINSNTSADVIPRDAVYLSPATDVSVADQINVTKKRINIEGGNAILRWSGANNTQSMIRVSDSSYCSFNDMILLGNSTNPPVAGLFFENVAGDVAGTNENIVVRNVLFGRRYVSDTDSGGSIDTGTPAGLMQNCLVVGGVDGNNDQFVIDNCGFHAASSVGLDFRSSQSIWSSVSNSLANGCNIGFQLGCNLMLSNVQFNRNVVCDIRGIRNTECWINGLMSENSNLAIWSTAAASFFVRGGKVLFNKNVAGNFFKIDNGGTLSLEDITVINSGSVNQTVYYRAGSAKDGLLYVRRSAISNGAVRSTWDVDTGGSGAAQSTIDIEHGAFRFKTTQPYLDRPITPTAVATNASLLLASGSANTPLGSFFNVSYGDDLQAQHLTVCPDSAGQIRTRIFNPTASAITLAANRFRWMNLADHIISSAAETVTIPTLSNNTGSTQTINLPDAKLGDFVVFGANSAYLNTVVTAYVSAPNTVSIRVHNASGGTSAPPATVFTVAKLREFGNFQNTLAYTPSAISAGGTVSFTVAVPHTQVGGHTFVSYSADLQGLICTAHVSSANTVTIVLSNYTAAAVTLAAGYFKVMVAF